MIYLSDRNELRCNEGHLELTAAPEGPGHAVKVQWGINRWIAFCTECDVMQGTATPLEEIYIPAAARA